MRLEPSFLVRPVESIRYHRCGPHCAVMWHLPSHMVTWLHRPTLRLQARGGGVSCCAGGGRILGPGSREGGLTMGSGFDCAVELRWKTRRSLTIYLRDRKSVV